MEACCFFFLLPDLSQQIIFPEVTTPVNVIQAHVPRDHVKFPTYPNDTQVTQSLNYVGIRVFAFFFRTSVHKYGVFQHFKSRRSDGSLLRKGVTLFIAIVLPVRVWELED